MEGDKHSELIKNYGTMMEINAILDLDKCNLHGDKIRALAEALKINRTLKSLFLCKTHLDSNDIEYLALALEENGTLEFLALNENNFGEIGALAIAKMLKRNKTLARLTLHGTNISENGAKFILEALYENSTLGVLAIKDNPITNNLYKTIVIEISKNHIIESLRKNCALKKIHKIMIMFKLEMVPGFYPVLPLDIKLAILEVAFNLALPFGCRDGKCEYNLLMQIESFS